MTLLVWCHYSSVWSSAASFCFSGKIIPIVLLLAGSSATWTIPKACLWEWHFSIFTKSIYFPFFIQKNPQATNLFPSYPPGIIISSSESILGSCRGSGLHSPGGAGVLSREILLWLISPPAHWAGGTRTWSCLSTCTADGTTAFPHPPALPRRCFQAPFLHVSPDFPWQKHIDPQMHICRHLENKITGSPLTPLSPLSPLDPWREITGNNSLITTIHEERKIFLLYNELLKST